VRLQQLREGEWLRAMGSGDATAFRLTVIELDAEPVAQGIALMLDRFETGAPGLRHDRLLMHALEVALSAELLPTQREEVR
jgi:hypothetical protein